MSDTTDGERAATISLVAGALGLTLLPMVGAAVAIIAGHLARRSLPVASRARRLATVGLSLGYAGLFLPLVLLVIAMIVDRPVTPA